jgi:hypothetical protein
MDTGFSFKKTFLVYGTKVSLYERNVANEEPEQINKSWDKFISRIWRKKLSRTKLWAPDARNCGVICTKAEEESAARNMRKYSVLFKDAENDSNHDDDSEVEDEEEKQKKKSKGNE